MGGLSVIFLKEKIMFKPVDKITPQSPKQNI